MPKIGDRYIIEIDRVYSSKKHQNSRYGIKGFANWVLTGKNIEGLLEHGCIQNADDALKLAYEQGIECGRALQIEDYKKTFVTEYETAYQRGLDDAWKAAEIMHFMPQCERGELFGTDAIYVDDMFIIPISDIIEKLKERKGQAPGAGSVVIAEGKKRVITRNWSDDYGRRFIDTIAADGTICSYLLDNVELTNESDPGVLALLNAMEESDG